MPFVHFSTSVDEPVGIIITNTKEDGELAKQYCGIW